MIVSEPMSKLSSHCRMIGIVFSIFFVATTLPSTLSVPVPPLPIPAKLLYAIVPTPTPSYLKSNSKTCRPGVSASGPSHFGRSRSSRFHKNTGLPSSR